VTVLEPLIYTLVAIALYVASDRILEQVEVRRRRRFEQRTLVFFAILATLALTSFALIRRLIGT
jgi:DMSO/TMAO reductase YedYZ heme-binding membrane subunit